jgi:metal-dependent hydrolase (beta-lactamase superfamily II)
MLAPFVLLAGTGYVNGMRMTVLASGSKGNSTVISAGRTRVLVDAGLSCRELLARMALAGEDPSTLNAILITHEHQDHVAALALLAAERAIGGRMTLLGNRILLAGQASPMESICL